MIAQSMRAQTVIGESRSQAEVKKPKGADQKFLVNPFYHRNEPGG